MVGLRRFPKHGQTPIDVPKRLIKVPERPLDHRENDANSGVGKRVPRCKPKRLHTVRQRGFQIRADVLDESERAQSHTFRMRVPNNCAMPDASVASACIRSHCSVARRA